MSTNNSINSGFDNNSDGFDIYGGTTPRKLTVTAGDLTLSSGGANTYTFPASTDTLVGRASTDTLTNKTITSPVINQFGTASGLGAAWDTWTPSWTNLTVGNATVVAKYKQVGKVVIGRVAITLGSTSSVSGQIQFTLPVTSTALDIGGDLEPFGVCQFYNNAANVVQGYMLWHSTTLAATYVLNVSGTYSGQATTSSTVPFTWATSFTFAGSFQYEAA